MFGFWSERYNVYTLPKTNGSHLKMDDWNTIVSLWGPAHFRVLLQLVWGSVPKMFNWFQTVVGFFLVFNHFFAGFFFWTQICRGVNFKKQRKCAISKVMKGKGNWEFFKIRLGAWFSETWLFWTKKMDVQCSICARSFICFVKFDAKILNTVCLISPFIIFRSLIAPSFGAPTGCRGMESNTWNLQVMVTNIYSMIHMITDFYPKIYDRSPVFLQRFNLCTVARCLKGQKASVAVFCSSSCGQVYRAIGSNSDCCQWCDDWIPNGSLFVQLLDPSRPGIQLLGVFEGVSESEKNWDGF